MSGHTPLPWKVLHPGQPHVAVVTEKWDSADGTLICYPGRHTGAVDGEVQANAEFIVRACNAHEELLEALRGEIGVASVPDCTDSNCGTCSRCRSKAAIAKAEGR